MNPDTILTLTATFEANAQQTETGVEYWLARDLQHLLGYDEWRNFTTVIAKAKTAARYQCHEQCHAADHDCHHQMTYDCVWASKRKHTKRAERSYDDQRVRYDTPRKIDRDSR